MKRSNILLALFVLIAGSFLFSVKAEAGTLNYSYIDGTAITATDTTGAGGKTDFANANTEITTAGYTVIAYMYDDCRQATTATDLSDVSSIVAVTSKNVTQHGTIGTGGIWFIYGKTLYITGSGTITDASVYNATNYNEITSVGTSFTKYKPSIQYGDIANDGYGIHLPAIGDEKTLKEKYYAYTDIGDTYIANTISPRESYTITDIPFGKIATGTFAPGAVGWIGSASSIETVYISDDLTLAGNLSLLFNANSGTYLRLDFLSQSVYTNLKNVYLYADTSEILSAAGMFARCPALEHVYVRDGKPANFNKCVNTSFMFYGDPKLSNGVNSLIDSMVLSSGTLTTTQYMFGGCSNINRPPVKDYDMSNVIIADGMFYGAINAGLTADGSGSVYDISGWNLGNLKSARFMFAGNMPQKSGKPDYADPENNVDPGLGNINSASTVTGTIDMSGWNLSNMVSAYFMFAQNTGLSSVNMGNDYGKLKDASGMFLRCDGLSNIRFNGATMTDLLYTTAMFRGAGRNATGGTADLSGVSFPGLINADHMFQGAGFATINMNNTSDLSSLVEAIAMFADNPNLTSLGTSNMSHVKFSSLINSSYMFDQDSSLSTINVGNWDMSKVVSVAHMFSDCTSLGSIDFSGWKVRNVLTNMECFAYHTSIPLVNLSGWDTSGVRNMFMAFAENSKLRTVTMPAGNTALSSVVNTNGMFYNDMALSSVSTLPVAPNLEDARGMFADCVSLTTVSLKELIGSKTKYAAFMFQRDILLPSVDISGWNTSNVEYMEGIFDGCQKLASITTGANLSGVKLLNIGAAFRNCHVLSNSSVNIILNKLTGTTALKDMYEMFKNCYALTTLDLTPMSLGSVSDLIHLAYMEEDANFTTNLLKTIKVPASILSAPDVILSDTSDGTGSCINMFWVDGDGAYDGTGEETSASDDLLTYFFVNGALNNNLAAYHFGGSGGDNDNRNFLIYNGRSINGKDTGTYALKSDSDSALLKVSASSTFYTGGTTSANATPLAPTYSWTKDGSAIAGQNTEQYKATQKGTYVGAGKLAKLTGTDTAVGATFIIGAKPVSINAVYKGGKIPIGGTYKKEDVEVKVIDEDGKEVTLTPNDFTLDSQTVTKAGANKYTVSYKSGDKTLTATITVPGIRVIGSIKAKYTGPTILVGQEYAESDVTVTAYYADDTSKKEGFEVKPSKLSSLKVTKLGSNTYTATYNDPDQDNKAFTAKYTVPGYKKAISMTAEYTGPKIKVGNQYSVGDVKVTLKFEGGGTDTTTDFTVDSKTILGEGDNSFKATYTDAYGTTLTAPFTVPGYDNGNSSSSSMYQNGAAISSIYGGTGNAYTGTQVYPAVTTGVVQTGTTGKSVIYIIAGFALLIIIGAAWSVKSSIKKKDK